MREDFYTRFKPEKCEFWAGTWWKIEFRKAISTVRNELFKLEM